MTVQTRSLSLLHTDVVTDRKTRIFAAGSALTILMALGAVARIPLPFTPVPFTLQTFFLMFGAMALGRRSAWSQGGYMALGAVGLPIFAGFTAGMAGLLQGVTTGYLLGFVLCALVVGSYFRKAEKTSVTKDGAVLALGMFCYFIPGMLWLKMITGMSLTTAFSAAVVPFVLMDVVKVTTAYGLYRMLRNRINRLF